MKNSDSKTEWNCGADLVVAQLEAQGVKHVFGIPGAKIDRVSTPCSTPASHWSRCATKPTPPLWPVPSAA
jgi:hypothetical protein